MRKQVNCSAIALATCSQSSPVLKLPWTNTMAGPDPSRMKPIAVPSAERVASATVSMLIVLSPFASVQGRASPLGPRPQRNDVFAPPAHLAVHRCHVPAIELDQVFTESRRLLGRQGLVGTVGRPVPLDEQIGHLLGGVGVFRTVIALELVVRKRRPQQRVY